MGVRLSLRFLLSWALVWKILDWRNDDFIARRLGTHHLLLQSANGNNENRSLLDDDKELLEESENAEDLDNEQEEKSIKRKESGTKRVRGRR